MKKIMEERMKRSRGEKAQTFKIRTDMKCRLQGEWGDQHRKR